MVSAIGANMTTTPGVRRTRRMAGAAILAAAFGACLSHNLASADLRIFNELTRELFHITSGITEPALTGLLTELIRFGSIAIFSLPATWTGYKLSGVRAIVVLVQLVALSLFFQCLAWQFLGTDGCPLSLVGTVLLGAILGYVLKVIDRHRRLSEAPQYALELRNRELRESRLALITRDETERRLMAADLHDQVLNDLRVVLQRLERVPQGGVLGNEDRHGITSLLRQSMTQVREIMDDLCPVILSEFGLAAAIEDRLDKASRNGKFEVRFTQKINEERLQSLTEVEQQLVYRLVQESLTNICKHAQATIVRVEIAEGDRGQIAIRIIDNGKGIKSDTTSESSRGMLYMRLRAALIGATVSWKPNSGSPGTTVEIDLHAQSTDC